MNVWGAITAEGLGPLIRLNERFTAAEYCNVIEQVVLPFALDGPFKDGLFYYQHDLSPIHTSRSVEAMLENLAIRKLSWPAKGADINPIENVWGIMKSRLSRLQLHKMNKDSLWAAVHAEWERLRGTELATDLFASMPRRMESVILAEGDFTKY